VLWSSSLYNFLYSSITSCSLCPHIPLTILFSVRPMYVLPLCETHTGANEQINCSFVDYFNPYVLRQGPGKCGVPIWMVASIPQVWSIHFYIILICSSLAQIRHIYEEFISCSAYIRMLFFVLTEKHKCREGLACAIFSVFNSRPKFLESDTVSVSFFMLAVISFYKLTWW
jgi:hypothetical protein